MLFDWLINPKILVLFVKHGSRKYPNAYEQLLSFYKNKNISYSKIVTIDNQLPEAYYEPMDEKTTLMGGDNRYWEFSAWQKALSRHQEELHRYDVVHFVTSAFNTLYTGFLHDMCQDQICAAVKMNACLAHIDCYDQPITLFHHHSQSWMRSGFFFVPVSCIKKISSSNASIFNPLAPLNQFDHFFSNNPREPFTSQAELSANYKKNITDWLTGHVLQNTAWHSQIGLTESTLDLFKKKATAILHEHYLTIHLREHKVPLLDTGWLKDGLQNRVQKRDLLMSVEEQVVRRRAKRANDNMIGPNNKMESTSSSSASSKVGPRNNSNKNIREMAL